MTPLESTLSKEQRWQLRQLSKGHCYKCGKTKFPVEMKYAECMECRLRRCDSRMARVADGRCYDCNKPRERDGNLCDACRRRRRENYVRRREEAKDDRAPETKS